PDARRWIARALRLDLPVLVERPDLAVPCVLRRCAWFGRNDARSLAADIAAAYGRPYLRSLRAPPVPLGAGVAEGYRTAAEGSLWLTADAIGVGTAVAWERASGRRIASTYVERAPEWKQEHRFGETGSTILVGPGGVRSQVALPEGNEAWSMIDLGDDY